MQLLCNGVALDLFSGAALSFKKTNPLFAFDALTCERTQAFSIPATPNNEQVFKLAKTPAFDGIGMRRRFECELQDGVTVKRGYLYVDKYDGGKYNAVFVTGDLIGLQAIKEAGNVSDLIIKHESIALDGSYIPANNQQQSDFASVLYARSEGRVLPSVNMLSVLNEAAAAVGVTVVYGQQMQNVSKYRIIPGGVKINEKTVTFENEGVRVFPLLGILEQENHTAKIEICTATKDEGGGFEYNPIGTYRQYNFPQWVCRDYDLELTFPDNFPDNFFCISGNSDSNLTLNPSGTLGTRFLGDYQFVGGYPSQSFRVFGTPLRGRTISVPKGTPFVFISSALYTAPLNPVIGQNYNIGIDVSGYRAASEFNVAVSTTSSVEDDMLVPYNGILPDASLVDLIKWAAWLSGSAIDYNDGVITFDPLHFGTWPTLNIDGSVISAGELTRTFVDYGQRNVVRFGSKDEVSLAYKLTDVYTIDNENIEAEVVAAELNLSEGEKRGGDLFVRNAGKGYELGIPTLARSYTDTQINMQRASIDHSNTLQMLFDSSTSVTIRARMTLYEYESMRAKTVILYAGTQYVWTEASWSNGVCTLNLSKIA